MISADSSVSSFLYIIPDSSEILVNIVLSIEAVMLSDAFLVNISVNSFSYVNIEGIISCFAKSIIVSASILSVLQ